MANDPNQPRSGDPRGPRLAGHTDDQGIHRLVDTNTGRTYLTDQDLNRALRVDRLIRDSLGDQEYSALLDWHRDITSGLGSTGKSQLPTPEHRADAESRVDSHIARLVSGRMTAAKSYAELLFDAQSIAEFLRQNYAWEISHHYHDNLTLSQVVLRYLQTERSRFSMRAVRFLRRFSS